MVTKNLVLPGESMSLPRKLIWFPIRVNSSTPTCPGTQGNLHGYRKIDSSTDSNNRKHCLWLSTVHCWTDCAIRRESQLNLPSSVPLYALPGSNWTLRPELPSNTASSANTLRSGVSTSRNSLQQRTKQSSITTPSLLKTSITPHSNQSTRCRVSSYFIVFKGSMM